MRWDDGRTRASQQKRCEEILESRRTSIAGRRRSRNASCFTRGGSTRFTRCAGRMAWGRRWTPWSSNVRKVSRFNPRRRIVDGRRAMLTSSIPQGTWTLPSKSNARCACWTARCSFCARWVVCSRNRSRWIDRCGDTTCRDCAS